MCYNVRVMRSTRFRQSGGFWCLAQLRGLRDSRHNPAFEHQSISIASVKKATPPPSLLLPSTIPAQEATASQAELSPASHRAGTQLLASQFPERGEERFLWFDPPSGSVLLQQPPLTNPLPAQGGCSSLPVALACGLETASPGAYDLTRAATDAQPRRPLFCSLEGLALDKPITFAGRQEG